MVRPALAGFEAEGIDTVGAVVQLQDREPPRHLTQDPDVVEELGDRRINLRHTEGDVPSNGDGPVTRRNEHVDQAEVRRMIQCEGLTGVRRWIHHAVEGHRSRPIDLRGLTMTLRLDGRRIESVWVDEL